MTMAMICSDDMAKIALCCCCCFSSSSRLLFSPFCQPLARDTVYISPAREPRGRSIYGNVEPTDRHGATTVSRWLNTVVYFWRSQSHFSCYKTFAGPSVELSNFNCFDSALRGTSFPVSFLLLRGGIFL